MYKNKSESDKRDRDDDKKTYVQLCKLKSTAYNNDQTNTLMREIHQSKELMETYKTANYRK